MGKYFPFLFVTALTGLPTALPQGTQVPFSITIDADTNVFKAGSEIRIRLVFKNTSAAEIPYVRGPGIGVEPHGEHFTDVEVRDVQGELLPETTYHRALRRRPATSAVPTAPRKSPPVSGTPKPHIVIRSLAGYMLKPGETREEDIVLTKLYDLSRPGQYSVSASRRLSEITTDPNFKHVAKSNTLTITIVE